MSIDLEALYTDLHRHPELSFQETRTAGIAAAHLHDLGLEIEEGVGITGVVGVLRNGDGPVVWARADMDALPVEEATGLPYASTAIGHRSGRQHRADHARLRPRHARHGDDRCRRAPGRRSG